MGFVYVVCKFICILRGVYHSYKAIRTGNASLQRKWTIFWVVLSIYRLMEAVTDLLLSWVPFYSATKTIVIIWFILTKANGASYIYKQYIHHLLRMHEKQLDEALSEFQQHAVKHSFLIGKIFIAISSKFIVRAFEFFKILQFQQLQHSRRQHIPSFGRLQIEEVHVDETEEKEYDSADGNMEQSISSPEPMWSHTLPTESDTSSSLSSPSLPNSSSHCFNSSQVTPHPPSQPPCIRPQSTRAMAQRSKMTNQMSINPSSLFCSSYGNRARSKPRATSSSCITTAKTATNDPEHNHDLFSEDFEEDEDEDDHDYVPPRTARARKLASKGFAAENWENGRRRQRTKKTLCVNEESTMD